MVTRTPCSSPNRFGETDDRQRQHPGPAQPAAQERHGKRAADQEQAGRQASDHNNLRTASAACGAAWPPVRGRRTRRSRTGRKTRTTPRRRIWRVCRTAGPRRTGRRKRPGAPGRTFRDVARIVEPVAPLRRILLLGSVFGHGYRLFVESPSIIGVRGRSRAMLAGVEEQRDRRLPPSAQMAYQTGQGRFPDTVALAGCRHGARRARRVRRGRYSPGYKPGPGDDRHEIGDVQ